MKPSKVKLVVFVPLLHTDQVREALGISGAGVIGNYSFCSFSSRGQGRFLGNDSAHPAIGKSGNLETVEEERIEVTVQYDKLQEVISEMKKVHPYEEVAYDVYPLLSE
jgi:hypothetical protein